MLFWVLAGLLACASVGLVLWPLVQNRGGGARRSSYDLQVYKDQLAEIDSDIERGTLDPAQAETTRAEISRRLLAAADRREGETRAAGAPRALSRGISLALAGIGLAAAFGLYAMLGAPGVPDQPFAQRTSDRPSQEAAEAAFAARAGGVPAGFPAPDPEHVALVDQLRDALRDRPDDLTGLRLLAENLLKIGEFAEARATNGKIVSLLGASATADDLSNQAEAMIFAAGFYISPKAEQALARALEKDPTNLRARYYAGLALLQRGLPEETYKMWTAVLEDSPPDAPWVPAIRAQLAEVARSAGLAGPTTEDLAGAADMNADEIDTMARGMVERLSARLADQGGTPAEWAQLIRALGVLGESERAAAIWAEAQTVFAASPGALSVLQEAAVAAGVAEQ